MIMICIPTEMITLRNTAIPKEELNIEKNFVSLEAIRYRFKCPPTNST